MTAPLEEIDACIAIELGERESVLSQIKRENPGMDELISRIVLDQYPRINSRYERLLKQGPDELRSRAFRGEFYNIIDALVREAKRHDKTRQEYNELVFNRCDVDPSKLLHSDAKYEDSLGFFQYHGYAEGFDGDVLKTET